MLKRYLLAPGPTPVPPEVLLSMARPMVHHRAPDFIPVVQSARDGLKWLFQTKNEVLVLTSSGTGGMVGSVNNFFNSGENVLVVNGGKFGERWTKICQAYGVNVKELMVEWGYAVKASDVEKALGEDPSITGVFVQACETSTGVYHDIEALAKVVSKRPGVLLVVDAISALVAHDIKTDAWGVDIVVGGSQKGLMLPPGLAMVSVSEKAWKKSETVKTPKFYFNFKKERENMLKNTTNFTSPVTHLVALNEAMKLMQAEGLENVFKRHAVLAKAMRAGVAGLGLKMYTKENPSNSVTAIEAPEGLDGQKIYNVLKDKYGITGAGGQDKLKGKIFRMATLGYAGVFDVITALSGVEMTLKGMGHKISLGAGVAAAEAVFMEEA